MLVDRKQPSSCRTTALRHIPLSLPTRYQPAYLISKATPSLTCPLTVEPSPPFAPPPWFAVDCTDHNVYAPVSSCIPLYAFVTPIPAWRTDASGRSESDSPGWSNPNNGRALNERGPGRGRVEATSRCFLLNSAFFRISWQSNCSRRKARASERALIREEVWCGTCDRQKWNRYVGIPRFFHNVPPFVKYSHPRAPRPA